MQNPSSDIINFLDCSYRNLFPHFLDCTTDFLIIRIKPKENLTSKWFEENWNTILPILADLLSKKFKKSRDSDMIQDLVMDFVLKYINKDGFRPVFEKGGKPTLGSIKLFAIRTTIDSLRKHGRDYSCRVIHGSKTSSEYRKDVRYSSETIEDKYIDRIDERIYINEKMETLSRKIIDGIDSSRHKNLISILIKLVSGEKASELAENFSIKDIKRVKRIIKKDKEN